MVEYGKSELDHITGRDPVMKTLAERFGYLEKGMTEDVFVALVESIVGQMLSNKAAGTLCGRLKNIVGIYPRRIGGAFGGGDKKLRDFAAQSGVYPCLGAGYVGGEV
ncbi:MAG: hypothetical protein ACLR06_05110 [Christensenellaceae bacterium]